MKKIICILSVLSAPFFFSQKKAVPKAEPKKESMSSDTKAALQLSKEELALYNGNFLKFISALKVSDRKGMDALLSEKAKKMVTEVVYQKLAVDIDTHKTFAVTKSGYKPFIDGSSYPMIQYKYADDKSAEPAKIITAVFERDGKIMGIKPYKTVK
ncbi:peptidylprolyl isomerase [Chryseobacterium sp. SN22]|uniref:peptidylprolyl isomerase n=1 Tax=Chryseobacterium sp. SN22 TaxID=2606431 RepID=UPI0011ED2D94|nr:peptidylprolyl isomerase [Chryseobacterium sp. SN22]KAA0126570.1 peptidylprolyl isomerase [Chryseobacterium sp. SN22]